MTTTPTKQNTTPMPATIQSRRVVLDSRRGGRGIGIIG
jgi:hypothetical protein